MDLSKCGTSGGVTCGTSDGVTCGTSDWSSLHCCTTTVIFDSGQSRRQYKTQGFSRY